VSPGDPEQSIEPDKARPRVLVFEHAQLLMQDSKLKPKTMARAKERTEPIQQSQEQPDHRASLHDSRGALFRNGNLAKWLIL
jgi:hypothetical protein